MIFGDLSVAADIEQAVKDTPIAELPALIGVLASFQAQAQFRMLHSESRTPPQDDRLLTVDEASEKLGMTKDYLYRQAKKLPFTVRIGRKQIRFSQNGIERYIKQRLCSRIDINT